MFQAISGWVLRFVPQQQLSNLNVLRITSCLAYVLKRQMSGPQPWRFRPGRSGLGLGILYFK